MRIRLTIIIILSFVICNCAYAQATIEMKYSKGVYVIPCTVNGLTFDFILDTGAATVTLSQQAYNRLCHQGKITKTDERGSAKFVIADGRTVESKMVLLRTVEIGGYVIDNVLASVSDSQFADLLLGQTVLQRIGDYTISGNKLILKKASEALAAETKRSLYEQRRIATKNRDLRGIVSAMEKIESIYGLDSSFDFYSLIFAHYNMSDYNSALKYFYRYNASIADTDNDYGSKAQIYFLVANIYFENKICSQAKEYASRGITYLDLAPEDSFTNYNKYDAYRIMYVSDWYNSNFPSAVNNGVYAIKYYMLHKDITGAKLLNEMICDNVLSEMFLDVYYLMLETGDSRAHRFLFLAFRSGSDDAYYKIMSDNDLVLEYSKMFLK